MSVVITKVKNLTGDEYGPHEYIVKINNGPVLARFVHSRKFGLAECLRLAADAVEISGEGGEWDGVARQPDQ